MTYFSTFSEKLYRYLLTVVYSSGLPIRAWYYLTAMILIAFVLPPPLTGLAAKK